MSRSFFQDFASEQITRCVMQGNKARCVYDGRKIDLEKSSYDTEYVVDGRKRVDYFAHIVYDSPEDGRLEENYAFEMKSCTADICSGCGMNFVGDRNFIVIPNKEFARRLGREYEYLTPENAESRLYDMDRLDVGIIEVSQDGTLFCWKAAGTTAVERWMRHFFLCGFGDEIADDAGCRIRDRSIFLSESRKCRRATRMWRESQQQECGEKA